MSNFTKLLDIADKLLSEEGCPWDRKQTMTSLQQYFIEEVHELIEAIDENDMDKIVEEAGDVLYTIIFLAKIGENNSKFSIEDIIAAVSEKLIRRHPHVFGDNKVKDADEVVTLWNKVKATEKEKMERKGKFDNIPKTLPSITKAQKVIHIAKVDNSKWLEDKDKSCISEDELNKELLSLIVRAEFSGVDVDRAFNREVSAIMKSLDDNKNTGD
jgi:tetrapyrrole methylase family protein / MazG family protein